MKEIINGCWRSCFVSRNSLPFVADAIIANPASLAHIHCAQRLGIPVHLMFTQVFSLRVFTFQTDLLLNRMPWSPTRSFPHPLAVIHPEHCREASGKVVLGDCTSGSCWSGDPQPREDVIHARLHLLPEHDSGYSAQIFGKSIWNSHVGNKNKDKYLLISIKKYLI